jgi:FAD/FMN-containing dehydrogenases
MSDATLIQTLQASIRGSVLADAESLQAVSSDFGRIVTKTPRVVVQPLSAEDIAAAILIANRYNVPVTARSAAHSQTGQALNQGGILIDMTSLNQNLQVNAEEKTCTVDAGMLWRDLVENLKPYKLIPPVLTNNLNVTIGGTHSMAGLGVASFRYGTQADNCLGLQVVTGAGEIVECSPTENSELFYHTLCGLGQIAIIAKAKLKLRSHQSHVRTFFLLYDNLKTVLKDQRMLIEEGRMDFLESFCTPLPMGFKRGMGMKVTFGEWFFPLHLTFEYDPDGPAPDPKKCLSGLSFYRHSHTEDMEIYDFITRMDNLFEIWRRMGYWANTHPWMECLLPWDVAEKYMNQILQNLPPASLGGGHVLFWPSSGRTSKMPLFKRPDSDYVVGFGILPGVPKDLLDIALPRLNMASELSEALGGKRYLSGYINFDKEKWKEHYDTNWSEFRRMKKKYDPNAVLNPGFIDFSA